MIPHAHFEFDLKNFLGWAYHNVGIAGLVMMTVYDDWRYVVWKVCLEDVGRTASLDPLAFLRPVHILTAILSLEVQLIAR